jgi:hypothetical protein
VKSNRPAKSSPHEPRGPAKLADSSRRCGSEPRQLDFLHQSPVLDLQVGPAIDQFPPRVLKKNSRQFLDGGIGVLREAFVDRPIEADEEAENYWLESIFP